MTQDAVVPLRGLPVPLRWRILGAFGALLTALLAASLWLAGRAQTRQVEAALHDQLKTASEVFWGTFGRRHEALESSLAKLSDDGSFKRAYVSGDPAKITAAAEAFRRRIGADAVWVADRDGRLVADTAALLPPGPAARHLYSISDALAQRPASQILVYNDAVFQTAAVPIKAPGVIGALSAGLRFDAEDAAELRRATRVDVSVARPGSVVVSSLPVEDRAALAGAAGGLMTADSPRLMGPSGARWLVSSRPIHVGPNGVSLFFQRAWDASLEPVRELRAILLIVGAAALALAVVAGLLIAEGITAPMEELVTATRRLVSGDYDVRVAPRRRDEVGELSLAFNAMVEGLREKDRIRAVLSKAVSREIADELLKKGRIELGGEERGVTMLFSDIRGFTTLSEGMPPKELVGQLNDYFKRMARAIEPHRGVIDKYVGDAIMALFGAPLAGAEDAVGAQRAALAMLKALDELNAERRAAGQADWRIGVGLNTGSAVAGTLGSEERWSYTVIGDAVNLASRLEGLTKHYGAAIVVSRATRDASAGTPFLYRSLDLVRVKGKHEPIEVFELLGEAVAPPAWLADSEAGVAAYRAGRLGDARASFAALLEKKPGDLTALAYLGRLDAMGDAPPEGWDPAHTMHDK